MKLSNRFANSAGAAALSLTILFSSLISTPHASYAATPITVGGKAIVTNTDGDNINVRAGAGTSNDKIAYAHEGETVTVLAGPKKDSDGNTWYKIQAPGGTGWVSSDYLDGKSSTSTKSTSTSSTKTTTKTTTKLTGFGVVANTDGDPLRVRSAPSKDGKVITTLAAGASVAIKQGPLSDTESIVWYQVSGSGVTGWVMGQYLAQSSAPSEPVAEKKTTTESKPSVESKPAVADTKPVVAKTEEKSSSTNAVTTKVEQAVTQPKVEAAVQTTSGLGSRVVSIAMNYVGYRYRYGGTTPAGFDCSGFVYYVYGKAGYKISRDMAVQWNSGPHISRENLAPGDILFWSNTYKRGLSHVGIYIGGGKFVNAENTSTGVVVSSLNTAYWASRYSGAVRPR